MIDTYTCFEGKGTLLENEPLIFAECTHSLACMCACLFTSSVFSEFAGGVCFGLFRAAILFLFML